MKVKFTIPGKPHGKDRPRFRKVGKFVQTYNTEATQAYTALVKSCYETQVGAFAAPAGVPVFVRMDCFFEIPKSWSKKKQAAMVGQYCLTKPDCDNAEKIVYDALNGLAYPDDSAVQNLGTIKTYTNAAPRVDVEMEWEETE